MLEISTCIYFIFFVDKNSLEFKVIDKDSNQDKYKLRDKMGLRHEDDDLEITKYHVKVND